MLPQQNFKKSLLKIFLNQIPHYYIIYNGNKWKKHKPPLRRIVPILFNVADKMGNKNFLGTYLLLLPSSDTELFMSQTWYIKLSTWKVWCLNQLEMPNFHFEQLSHSSRLAQSGILTLDWLIGTVLILLNLVQLQLRSASKSSIQP